MKISSKKADTNQPWLFVRPINCMAITRNLCGDFFEQATAAIGGHKRNRTDGTADYCPDLSDRLDANTYHEVKSVGRSSTSIIYAGRLEKDYRFTHAGNALNYWFWHHSVEASKAATVEDLYVSLAGSLSYVIILPYELVRTVALGRPLKMLNKKYNHRKPNGYACRSKGYGDGYSIPLSNLKNMCTVHSVAKPFEVFGNRVDELQVFTCDPPRHYLA